MMNKCFNLQKNIPVILFVHYVYVNSAEHFAVAQTYQSHINWKAQTMEISTLSNFWGTPFLRIWKDVLADGSNSLTYPSTYCFKYDMGSQENPKAFFFSLHHEILLDLLYKSDYLHFGEMNVGSGAETCI